MTSPAGSRPSARQNIEDTTKDFWSTRPRRPRHGRKIAGVAAAIGNRYGVDPVLVRVGLVVATIVGGFGILFYLLGWLFLPEENDEVSGAEALLGKGRSSMSPGQAIVLGLLLIPVTAGTIGGSWLDGGGFVLLVLFLVALYTLHRTRGATNRPLPTSYAAGPATFSAHAESAPPEATAAAAAATAAASGATAPEATAATPGTTAAASGPGYGDLRATTPGGWDPLGAAPLGWDLPGPDAPQPPPPAAAPTASTMPMPRPRPKSRISYVTAGLALITASVGLTLGLSGVDWFSAAHVIGLTLGVLGVGMVAASFAGAGRGLVVLALPLAAAGIALTAIPFDRLPGGGVGEVNEAPTSLAELEPTYERTMGSVRLDLTQLDTDEPIRTAVNVGMGEAVVIVPAEADVTFTCDANMGEVNCLDARSEGMGMAPVSDTSLGDDGEGGQQIELDVSARTGSVVIERG